MKRFLILLLLALFLSACTALLPPPPAEHRAEKVFQKNYVIGQEAEAFVGDNIIKLRDYMLLTTELNAVSPTVPISVKILSGQVEFVPQEKYTVFAYAMNEGQRQKLVLYRQNMPIQMGSIAIAIRPDGTISKNTVIKGQFGWQPGLFDATTTPSSATMKSAVREEIDAHALFENHELLYNGTDGKSIFITYREFTQNDLARPAFFQNLTYDAKTETIRFKKYKIRIANFDNERIRFVVMEDGR